jgi:MSHA biogenesis protein MshQ
MLLGENLLARRCGFALLQRITVPRGLLLALLGGFIAASLSAPARAQVLAQIQVVGYSTSSLSSTAATSYSVTVPAGVLVGDFMLFVGSNNPGTGGGNPNGWTYLESNITNNNSLGFSVWYRIATSADVAGSTVYTWTVTSSSRVGGALTAFRGVDNTNPVVGFSTSSPCPYTTGVGCATEANSTAGTSRTAPSLTPGVANSTLVALYSAANGSADTPTAPSGMTQIFAAGTGAGTSGLFLSAFYERFAAATASGAFVSTGGNSAPSLGASVALQPATVSPSAYWHLDQAAWTGATGEVVDSGGSVYNGVAAHSATTTNTSPALAGSPGTCYYGAFNGSTQYVEMPSSLPHVGNEFTVTAWIRLTANQVGRIWMDDENNNGYGLSFYDSGSAKLRMYTRSPSTVYVDSNITLSLNTWYFVAISSDVTLAGQMYMIILDSSGNQLDVTSLNRTSFSAGTGSHATVGGNDDGQTTGVLAHFAGNIDEVTMFLYDLPIPSLQAWALTTHSCPLYNVPNHYAVSTPGTAVNCAPAAVTITAHSSSHAAVPTTDTIALTTSTNNGDWTLTSGSGTFTASGSDAGTASYTYASADAGVVVLALLDTHAETVTIGVTDGSVTATSGTALASEDSPLTFVASGFIITNGSNVATTIGTQVAGVTSTQSLALQAVRTDTKTGACTSVFASGKTVSIGLGYQCNNPVSCVTGQTLKLTNNGTTTSLPSNPNSTLMNYTSVPIKFSTANAEAPFTLVYSDAGQITLDAKYVIPLGNGSSSGSTMLGAAQFVVQPYTLQLSNIIRTSNSFANPAASTPTGTVFMPAGQPFTATVTAYSSPGTAVTPNFGQETSPASVSMATNQVLATAVGGNDFPAISGSFGSYTTGAATGTAFSWPEVGIMTITPSVASYLGSGTVTGTTTGDVGRFIPNNFLAVINTPQFATACSASAGSFTYLGQPFTYYTAPVITVTAQALGGATTLNYVGSLFRLSDTNNTVTLRTYTPTPSSPGLTTTGLPAATTDPTIVSLGGGVGTLTFGAGTGLLFTRGTPIAPLSANIALSYNVIDLDSVAATTNPVTFGAGTGITFHNTINANNTNTQYYGRLALRDALGSELLDLPMSLTTQYYVSTTAGFTANTADSCTTAPAIVFSSPLLHLSYGPNGATCVRDTGNPGVSGAGCTAAGPSAEQYDATAVAGGFNLWLLAPGAGNNGAATVTATAPAWLQYLWSAAGPNSSPAANATFGVFPGPGSRIYQREVY